MTNLIEQCVALFEDTLRCHYEIRVPAPACLADMASTIIPIIQAEERARIVAWLNDRKAVSAFYIDHTEAGLAADCIEAGDHLK